MKYLKIILGLIVIGFVMVSCTPSAPSTLEIMDTFVTKVNERDLEGLVALFAEDALYEESYKSEPFQGTKEIEHYWKEYYFPKPFIVEFRDISVEGNSATFIWADVGTTTKGASYIELRPGIIEVQKGKITHMDIYEDSETIIGD
jgi:ketosteroid isomerase-like protein